MIEKILNRSLYVVRKGFILWIIAGMIFTGLYKLQKMPEVQNNIPKNIQQLLWKNFK